MNLLSIISCKRLYCKGLKSKKQETIFGINTLLLLCFNIRKRFDRQILEKLDKFNVLKTGETFLIPTPRVHLHLD